MHRYYDGTKDGNAIAQVTDPRPARRKHRTSREGYRWDTSRAGTATSCWRVLTERIERAESASMLYHRKNHHEDHGAKQHPCGVAVRPRRGDRHEPAQHDNGQDRRDESRGIRTTCRTRKPQGLTDVVGVQVRMITLVGIDHLLQVTSQLPGFMRRRRRSWDEHPVGLGEGGRRNHGKVSGIPAWCDSRRTTGGSGWFNGAERTMTGQCSRLSHSTTLAGIGGRG